MTFASKRVRFETYDGQVLDGKVEAEKMSGLIISVGDTRYHVPYTKVIEELPRVEQKERG